MNKEFVPQEQSLDLKELGFDEPCFGFYQENNNLVNKLIQKKQKEQDEFSELAPLYQQAFRWFREKYNLQCSINFYSESLGIKKVPNHYEIQIDYLSNNKWCYFENINNKIYLTYEEAELECLKKLIEIVKGK